MLTLLPSSGRQVLSTESGTRRQPVFAAAVPTTTTTHYTMTGSPSGKRQSTPPTHGFVDCTRPQGGPPLLSSGSSGRVRRPRCIPASPGPAPEPPQGEARCPHSAPSALNSPPRHPQVQRKTLLPGPPALGGKEG